MSSSDNANASPDEWRLYSVYFETKKPFNYEHLEEELDNHNDIVYDGMDFQVSGTGTGSGNNKKACNYGYWFYVHSCVLESFENFVRVNYGDNIVLKTDWENFIVRRSSGRTSYKTGMYKV